MSGETPSIALRHGRARVEGGWRDIRWSTLKRLLTALDADLQQFANVIDQEHKKR
jgi:hypothetical protein